MACVIWKTWVAMSTEPHAASHHDDDQPSVARLLSLSDGVVAIALTLLVLQLRVPPLHTLADPNSAADLAAQLGDGANSLISYVISFYIIANFWLIHHRVFRQISGHHEGVAWWNFAFLFTITVMPFTSDLIGSYASNPLAVDIFAFNLLLASVATLATLTLGRRKGLLTKQTNRQSLLISRVRTGSAALVLCVSMGLAWVNTDAAKYCWLLIGLAPAVANRWFGRRLLEEGEPAATTQ
jgi:uncharacterized membrane protein